MHVKNTRGVLLNTKLFKSIFSSPSSFRLKFCRSANDSILSKKDRFSVDNKLASTIMKNTSCGASTFSSFISGIASSSRNFICLSSLLVHCFKMAKHFRSNESQSKKLKKTNIKISLFNAMLPLHHVAT